MPRVFTSFLGINWQLWYVLHCRAGSRPLVCSSSLCQSFWFQLSSGPDMAGRLSDYRLDPTSPPQCLLMELSPGPKEEYSIYKSLWEHLGYGDFTTLLCQTPCKALHRPQLFKVLQAFMKSLLPHCLHTASVETEVERSWIACPMLKSFQKENLLWMQVLWSAVDSLSLHKDSHHRKSGGMEPQKCRHH